MTIISHLLFTLMGAAFVLVLVRLSRHDREAHTIARITDQTRRAYASGYAQAMIDSTRARALARAAAAKN